MNILFFTNNRFLGGTVRILQSWLLLGPSHGLHGFVVVPTGSDFCQWLAANGIPYIESRMAWPNRRKPWQALSDAAKVILWARRYKIGLLHCNEHDVYPFAHLVRRFLRRPMVCHVRYKLERGFASWAFGRSRCPDLLLWTSRQQKEDSRPAIDGIVPEGRQHIVPLGFELTRFGTRTSEREVVRQTWGVAPDDIVLGQCCALRPRKRLEDFIDLIADLSAENDRVVGVLAGDALSGDEAYREKLLQHIDRRGVAGRFRRLGNLNDVEPFYQAIDLFVSTSEYETFGNSVCEAMACARPVIGYAGGSVREVVGDTGAIVETLDYRALLESARGFVADPAARQSAGRRGQERVDREFNPAATIRRVKALYESLERGPTRSTVSMGAKMG